MAISPDSSLRTPPTRPTNDRSAARLAVVQALYQTDATNAPVEQIIKDFLSGRIGGIAIVADADTEIESVVQLTEPDTELFVALMRAVQERSDDIDNMIKGSLSTEWPWTRLEMTLRAVLRAGAAELLTQSTIPPKVSIAEYVDVAHAFYSGPEPGMVNAVLDRIAKALGRN
jgi:transcription antitermination protein NusB